MRSGPPWAARPVLWLIPLLFAVLPLACDSGQGGTTQTPTPAPRELDRGLPRPFRLGLGSFPREPTDESYREAFALAGDIGELILIQRAPPWSEFVEGGTLSKDTEQATRKETNLAKENDLDIFFAIDPTDPADRGRLQGLPDALTGKSFADDEVRKAFLAYVKYVALNYRPKALAVGIEMNMYYEQRPADFDSFVTLYAEAYDAVKAISAETLVFPTFQLEAMHSLLPGSSASAPQWALLGKFEPRLDLVAFSSYPSFVFDQPASIPASYFSEVRRYSAKPIAIAGAGYSSGPGREGLNEGTEAEQAAFVERILEDAERLEMPFVIWSTGCDPAVPAEPPFDLYDYSGLCRSDGSHKPAWLVWAAQAARPARQGQ